MDMHNEGSHLARQESARSGISAATAKKAEFLTFRLGAEDIGRKLQDLELSYKPVELRSCIDDAHQRLPNDSTPEAQEAENVQTEWNVGRNDGLSSVVKWRQRFRRPAQAAPDVG